MTVRGLINALEAMLGEAPYGLNGDVGVELPCGGLAHSLTLVTQGQLNDERAVAVVVEPRPAWRCGPRSVEKEDAPDGACARCGTPAHHDDLCPDGYGVACCCGSAEAHAEVCPDCTDAPA